MTNLDRKPFPSGLLTAESRVALSGMPVAEGGSGATNKPLEGLCIVVTRPLEQSTAFIAALEVLGARVLAIPTIRIEPATDPTPLQRTAAQPQQFDWIVFT